MYVDERMIAQRHREDITSAATTRLARALRGQQKARRRHLTADRGHLPLAGEHLARALRAS